MQTTQMAEKPVIISDDVLEEVTTTEDIKMAHRRDWRFIHPNHGWMMRKQDALSHVENGNEVLTGPDPLPNDLEAVETETFYHVTPELNKESIQTNGLDVSRADNTTTGNGVYVAPSQVDAENWAHVLCGEEGWVWFDILRVEIPKCLPVLPDKRIREEIRWKYPDANVVSTAYGIPPRFIEFEVEAFKADVDLSPRG